MHFQSVANYLFASQEYKIIHNWVMCLFLLINSCMLLTVQLQAYLRVTVDVVDVNDPPRFADQQETIAVTEVSNHNTCMTKYE